MLTSDSPIAVLIDGENISYRLIGRILAQAEQDGSVVAQQIYLKHSARWVIRSGVLKPQGAWYDAALCYDFEVRADVPVQAGKNAVDIALTVGAMDLFHTGIRQFCLATSDSDFVALVSRLPGAGCMVLGIGNVPTSNVLRDAYTSFVETTNLAAPVPWTRLWEVIKVVNPESAWNPVGLRKRRRGGPDTLLALTPIDWEFLQDEADLLQEVEERET